MAPWADGIGAVTLFVENLAVSREFYGRAFEAPLVHRDDDSVVFRFGAILVNLLQQEAARELVEPATAGDPAAGPRAVLSIEVDDVDARCAALSARGVQLLNGPMDRPWGIRTASFCDPDGHVWEIGR